MKDSLEVSDLIKKYFSSEENIDFGYLFGSYSDESFTNRSDVDIAIFLKDASFDAQLRINHELSKKLNIKVDLVILNSVINLYLLEDIINKGILLKDSDVRIKFELSKHHQFLDYIEFKKRINAA